MSYPQGPYGQGPYGSQHHYPQQGYQQPGYGAWGPGAQVQPAESGESRLAFIRKVYGLFAGSVFLSAVGAMIALYAGASSSQLTIDGVTVPPLVALVGGSPIIAVVLTLGLVFGTSAVRRVRGLNVAALFTMSFLLGILFAPSLFVAQLYAGMGGTLSDNPVRDAFILAAVMFGGLTAYVMITKKDFSYLGGALVMGLFVILGAAILNLFIASNVFGLAIASVGVLLFGGYVLYDTSRILKAEEREPVGAAIQLYLDFLNIFLYLLRILGSRR